MKKRMSIHTFFLAIASLMVISSCALRRSEPIKGIAFHAEDTRVRNGEIVYMDKCQKCHPGGEGGLGPGINPLPVPSFIKQFQIRHGLGVMPAFKKDEISKQDLKDITRYLHAWKHY